MSRGNTVLGVMGAGLMMLAAVHASAAPFFADSFESASVGSGIAGVSQWVGVSNAGSDTRVFITDAKASDNDKSLAFYGNSPRVVKIKNALDVTGMSAIVLSLDVAQSNTSYESNDYFSLKASFDGGSTFTGILTDFGAANGFGTSASPAEYSGTALQPASAGGSGATTFVSYYVQVDLPTGATSFVLEFTASGSTDNEFYYLDNVTISGVPEPASLALLAIGGLMLGVGRRRS